MGHFIAEVCRGPFDVSSHDIIEQVIKIVRNLTVDGIGVLWDEFSFMEYILEVAAEDVGGDDVGMAYDNNPLWLENVRWRVGKKLYQAAEAIYLTDRDDCAVLNLDGKSWITTGGMTWEEYPTEACYLIRFIRHTGLDILLESRNKTIH
jgi:hypothetical protein